MMKRLTALLMGLMLTVALAGCRNQGDQPATDSGNEVQDTPVVDSAPEAIHIAALKGPTSMGMVKMMEDNEAGQTANTYEFELAGSPTELTGRIIQGEIDIAAVPVNLASVLYNKTGGQIELTAINTLGVLYIIENGESIGSIADLAGKTIYATGKGSTPEYTLNYILEQNGLTVGEDVQVEYKSEHSELASLLAAGQAEFALLPQPFVTSVLNQNENARVALDLNEEWQALDSTTGGIVTGCVIIQKSFIEEHPGEVDAFLAEYAASTAYTNDNLEEAAALCEKYDIIKSAVAQQAIPACNIVYIDGAQMKETVSEYLNVLAQADLQAVGGQLPDDGFYYGVQ